MAFLFTKISWESTAFLGPKSWRFLTNAAASLLRFGQGRYVVTSLGCFVQLPSDYHQLNKLEGSKLSAEWAFYTLLCFCSWLGGKFCSSSRVQLCWSAKRNGGSFKVSSSTTSWHSVVFPHPGWKQFPAESDRGLPPFLETWQFKGFLSCFHLKQQQQGSKYTSSAVLLGKSCRQGRSMGWGPGFLPHLLLAKPK